MRQRIALHLGIEQRLADHQVAFEQAELLEQIEIVLDVDLAGRLGVGDQHVTLDGARQHQKTAAAPDAAVQALADQLAGNLARRREDRTRCNRLPADRTDSNSAGGDEA